MEENEPEQTVSQGEFGLSWLATSMVIGITGLVSRGVIPQQTAEFMGSHMARGVFEHSLEAVGFLPFIFGLSLFVNDFFMEEDLNLNKIDSVVNTMLPRCIGLYWAWQLFSEVFQSIQIGPASSNRTACRYDCRNNIWGHHVGNYV